MSTNVIAQLISAVLLTIAAFFLANPFGMWMPEMTYMIILAGAVAIFGAFSVFVLMEQAGDERENEHRHSAGRIAFLAGGAVLILGIIVQTFAHTLDPWLVWALLAMVVAKSAVRLYSAYNH
jgi:NADH:ubiquinone oxidoreductase subunit 6 (subunit J)